MITITMFGKEMEMFDFDAKYAIEHMNDLKESIKKPQIIGGCGYSVIRFTDYKEYEHDSTVSSDTICRFALDTIGFNGHLYDGIMENSIEDEEETKRINEGYTGIYNHKITLNDEMQRVIVEEANRVQKELAAMIEAERKKKAEEKAKAEAEKAELLGGVKWETVERKITDEGGTTTMYIHTITIDGKTFKITERNVFDVGRCINAECGGLYSKAGGTWHIERFKAGEGWIPEEISDANQRAAEIVHKYGGFVRSGIRM